MPSVNISDETYEKLRALATRKGCTMDAVAQIAVNHELLLSEMTEEEYQQRWDDLLRRMRSGVPAGVTEDEIEADVAAAVAEVRAERRARGR